MKTLKITFLTLVAALLLTGCSDDDNAAIDVNGNANAIVNNLKSGTWRITNYTDDGVNETLLFDGYNFDFDENGTVAASNQTVTYNGTWQVADIVSGNGNVTSISFTLNFNAPDTFADELDDDWQVIERSGTKVVLADIDADGSNSDYLTFEKN